MNLFGDGSISEISVADIDFGNIFYKVSRGYAGEELMDSVRKYGILDKPVVLKEKDFYIVIFGHNRLSAIKSFNQEKVNCIVVDKIIPEEYLKHIIRKHYNHEISPITALRIISILQSFNYYTKEEIEDIASKDLNIPAFFLMKDETLDRVFNLADILKNYMDSKNIGYKIIRNILNIEFDFLSHLIRWMEGTDFRVNIFKDLVDFIIDISKRGMDAGLLIPIAAGDIQNSRDREAYYHNELFKIRYPEYSHLKRKIELITERITKKGIEVELPANFEGDSINIKIKVDKKGKSGVLKEIIKKIDYKDIDEILNHI